VVSFVTLPYQYQCVGGSPSTQLEVVWDKASPEAPTIFFEYGLDDLELVSPDVDVNDLKQEFP
jgi:hypothetical protein